MNRSISTLLINTDDRFCSPIGHHAVYEATHLLHRDVSIDNIMFHNINNGETRKVIGVMCDWDLAKELDPSDIAIGSIVKDTVKSMFPPDTPAAPTGEEQNERQNLRTGTVPFMALDLLTYDQVPRHLYRHDLESFFYVLVLFIAKYNPKTRTLGYIEGWLKGSLKDIGYNKAEAVRDILAVEAIMEGGHPDYVIFIDYAMNILTRLVTPTLDAYTALRRTMTTALSKVPRSERKLLSQEQKIALQTE